MKYSRLFAVLSLSLLLTVGGMTACGSSTASSGKQGSTAQQITEARVEPSADPKAAVDAMLGSWTDINEADRFVNITKTETGYQYEDNEGKYPATFGDGILKVQVSDADTADVYIDAKTGHLLAIYQGSTSEFGKK